MKKRLFELCISVVTLITAILWLVSTFVEGFDFSVMGFFATTLCAVGLISIVFGIIEKKYWRIILGGVAVFFGGVALLARLDLLKGVAIICIIIIVGAITSILSIVISKGNKWDAGNND